MSAISGASNWGLTANLKYDENGNLKWIPPRIELRAVLANGTKTAGDTTRSLRRRRNVDVFTKLNHNIKVPGLIMINSSNCEIDNITQI